MSALALPWHVGSGLNSTMFSPSMTKQGAYDDDEEVIERAFAENRVLVTNDKDFGEKVYRERLPHRV